MSIFSYVIQLPTAGSVAPSRELNPRFHGAGRRTAAVEGKRLPRPQNHSLLFWPLRLLTMLSNHHPQQRWTRWSCVLCAPTRHVGNTAVSLWHYQNMNLGKSKRRDCYDHLQKCLTTSQTREEQVLSLLKQAEHHNLFLSSYSCTLGEETGKREQGSAAPLSPFTSIQFLGDSGGTMPPPHPSQESPFRARMM